MAAKLVDKNGALLQSNRTEMSVLRYDSCRPV